MQRDGDEMKETRQLEKAERLFSVLRTVFSA